jgi:thiosulfate dehydrogenase (quinone) large subunit
VNPHASCRRQVRPLVSISRAWYGRGLVTKRAKRVMAKSRTQKRSKYPVRSSSVHAVRKTDSDNDGDILRRSSPNEVSPSRWATLFSEPGTSLLVLRAFLGVTFTFAGLQKLANPNFFRATAPGSFQQQLQGSIRTSPLHHLLSPVLHASMPVALVISFGEVAVGLGTILGLFGRMAAVGGLLLSFSFFLTVSFNDNPYYYGPDIVFLFAWTPFVLSGPGAWSLDGLFAQRAKRAHDRLEVTTMHGEPAAVRAAELERRVFLQKASAAGGIGIAGLVTGGVVAAIGRLLGGSQPATSAGPIGRGGSNSTTNPSTSSQAGGKKSGTTTSTTPRSSGAARPKGIRIGPANDVPVGGAGSFTDPKEGVPALVVQIRSGVFRAFSAVCPHAGCQVEFDGQSDLFICPCHGSTFSGSSGAVQRGPAATGLSSIPVALGSNGQLYVDG